MVNSIFYIVYYTIILYYAMVNIIYSIQQKVIYHFYVKIIQIYLNYDPYT